MMRMFRLIIALCLAAPAAQAQQFTLPGQWSCTVNARSTDPSGNYGLEAYMQVSPDGSLFA